MSRGGAQPPAVPWTERDAWLGVAFVAVWLVVFIAAAYLFRRLELDVDVGLLIGVAELALLVPAWWLGVRKHRVGWEALGLRGFKGAALGLGCSLMIAVYVINCGYTSFLARFNLPAQASMVPLMRQMESAWPLMVAGIVVAPMAEEVFFRGFLFAGLGARYGWRAAAVISSALFALIHLQPLAFVPIFGLGCAFACVYYRSRSIWPAVIMHVSENALALGAAYVIASTDMAG